MSVISKASLVQIPSGYGEDKLYSEVPNTTAGDFTFTRASTGTRVNANGYIEEVPWNLNTYSEDFTNSSYIKDSGITIASTNNVSPIGNNTATQIDVTSSGRIYKNVTSGAYKTSVYLKAGTFAYFKFANSQIDLNLGTISSPYSSSIEDVGNGWYRISVSFVTTIRPFQVQAYPDNTYTTHTQSGNYFIWGSMLNYGDTTKPYIKTTDRLDIPRLDYSGGASCPTLLLENQSTNLVTYSEDMSSSIYAKSNVTFTGQTTTAPDGNQVEFITVDGYIFLNVTAIGGTAPTTTRTFSFYVKAQSAGYEILYRRPDGFTILTVVSHTEWTRIEATSLSTSTNIMLTDNRAIQSVGNVAFWGVQFENQLIATSYIPTSGTSVTRVQDVCEDAGDATIFNDSEGVLFTEIAALNNDLTFRGISLSDGTTANRIVIYLSDVSNRIRLIIRGNNVLLADLFYDVSSTLDYHKIAAKYKADDFALWIDGVEVATDLSGTSMPIGLNEVRFANANGGAEFYGKCKQVAIFNEALTDTELQTLTTI